MWPATGRVREGTFSKIAPLFLQPEQFLWYIIFRFQTLIFFIRNVCMVFEYIFTFYGLTRSH